MKTLILTAMILTACGTDSNTAESVIYPATAETVPDFSRWAREPGAEDSCSLVDATGVLCQTRFTADDENCGNATFKFVAIKDGYMYVQTKLNVIVRQGEDHTLSFDEKPEIFNITDKFIEQYYHVFECEGQNG
jgi:hypothetical protein